MWGKDIMLQAGAKQTRRAEEGAGFAEGGLWKGGLEVRPGEKKIRAMAGF